MSIGRHFAAGIATLAIVAGATSSGDVARAQQKETGVPETVIVTVHAKAGAEAELARVLARHWETATRLNLVRDTPRLSLRGKEGDKLAFYVEIFTWRDSSIPDSAPPEIQAIWVEMNKLAEARGGRPAIDIAEVSVVVPD